MRLRRIACLVAASAVLSGPASASHTTFDFSAANLAANAYSTTTWSVFWGAQRPTSMTLSYPTGWRWAHADDANSPVSPPPVDGDTVGSGTLTARWAPFCSSPPSDRNVTVTWDDTPSGSVAQVTVSSFLLFSFEGYVVQNGTNDYELVFPDFPDTFMCSNTTDGSMSLSIYGTVPGTTRRVTRNPASTGSYTASVTYDDVAATTHTATDSVTIV